MNTFTNRQTRRIISQIVIILSIINTVLLAEASNGMVTAEILDSGFQGQRYTYTFAGHVLCGSQACSSADVTLTLRTSDNAEVQDHVVTAQDGSYEFTVSLDEELHDQLDWTLEAHKEGTESKEVQGRRILTDESAVKVEAQIALL